MPKKKTDNVINLYRELMKGITLQDVKLPVMQDGNIYRDFCQYCNQVFTSPFFETLKRSVTLTQVEKTGLDSTCHEETQFGRATINGVALWEEIFKKYSKEFEDKFMGNRGDFNPNRTFNSVTDN